MIHSHLETAWTVTITVAHVAGAVLVSWGCLSSRKDPASTVLWIFLSIALPVFGPLLYLMFGVNRVVRLGFRKRLADELLNRHRRDREVPRQALSYWRSLRRDTAHAPASTVAQQFNRGLDTLLPDHPLLGGNRVEILVTGDEALPAMLRAIGGASRHVHLQTYILDSDPTGRDFLAALRDCARNGVTVRVLYDPVGSSGVEREPLFRELRKTPGASVCKWTQATFWKRQIQVNLRNHRKILVIDGRIAFCGGINFDSVNRSAPGRPADRDYHFRISGPAVHELQYTFLRDWYFATDESPDDLLCLDHFPEIAPTGSVPVRVVNSGPSDEVPPITDVIFLALTLAKRQLLAVTPYFAPSADLIRALRSAALRGVDVRLVVPRKNNHRIAGLAARAHYDELLAAGVRVFERDPPFLHAKAIVADDILALVGSANLDTRSLRLNYETDLAIISTDFADRLKAEVHEELAHCREIDLNSWRQRPVAARVTENLAALLTPVL